MKRFAFYVSNNATRLKKFLNEFKDHPLIKSIIFVLIDNNSNLDLKILCRTLSINLYEVDLKNVQNKNQFISKLLLDYLIEHNIDYCFVFANRILEGELLVKYKNRLINFHPSILPSHKGLNAIDQALKSKTFLLGNTAHFITQEVDSGLVIMQNILPSIKFSGYDDVLDKQIVMLLQLMDWINNNRLKIIDDRVVIEGASYEVSEFIPNIDLNIIKNYGRK